MPLRPNAVNGLMSNHRRPITIVGGGLAGLTLGIGLRHESIPVTVLEAGRYPRHRVCGEFISGRGQGTLTRLGLAGKLTAAGAIPATTTVFFSRRAKSAVRELTESAWSISRYALDALLANEFRRLGGELRENQRWRGNDYGDGMVRATGRRIQATENGWRWFGLKVHARNVELDADLEMYLAPSSYLGISRLSGGEVNICGLFRRPAAARQATEDAARHLAEESGLKTEIQAMINPPGSPRYERLANAVFDEQSFCAVAGLSLRPRHATESADCCIGDGITMIPPITGNGMSMAFESAELAIDPLAAYSRGESSWGEAKGTIARLCDERFAERLKWAWELQRLVFVGALQGALVRIIPGWERLWRLTVGRTR